jgi:hypothetical protein
MNGMKSYTKHFLKDSIYKAVKPRYTTGAPWCHMPIISRQPACLSRMRVLRIVSLTLLFQLSRSFAFPIEGVGYAKVRVVAEMQEELEQSLVRSIHEAGFEPCELESVETTDRQ